MTVYVRGSNPVWLFADLTGHLFDDTFYMFVLENQIPYAPATVYHTISGIPWTNPIQFLANGTLHVDIFWDPDVVYRLEFRQGPTQSDPLIYEVDNYSPGGNGDTPIDTTAIATDNQITNPQFSIINFSSAYTLTATNPDPIEVAPGWFLNLTGTGTVVLERLAITSTLSNPTNAPYALRITLSGTWTGTPYLSQRFNQNGMLWSTFTEPRYVSSSVTARIQGAPQNISAQLYDSMGTPLTTVLASIPVTDTFNEYVDHGLMPATTNTDTPPTAWIEYRLFLPTTVDIYLTSFQLVTSNSINNFQYIQDTIERQQDYTFHYYRDSLLRQQKESVLTGWDFGLNPWQAYPVTATNLATFGYTADQTIVIQQAYVAGAVGNNISTARGAVTDNYGFKVAAVTANNQFAMVQYIDPATIRAGWGKVFSSLVKIVAQIQNPALTLRMKMKLIYRTTLPSALSQTEPVASWAASGEPVFAAGWTALSAENDPVYMIVNGANTLLFEGFSLPASSAAAMTLGIVLYTEDSMLSSGTPDNIVFNKVSLVQNDFAIEVPSLTFDETLKRCQYYYETSFEPGGATLTTGPQRASIVSAVYAPMNAYWNAGAVQMNCVPNGFGLQYKEVKRAAPTLSFYPGSSTNLGNILAFVNGTALNAQAEATLASFFTTFGGNGVYGFSYRGTGLSTMVGPVGSTAAGSAGILYQYIANSRLGV